MPQTVVTTCYNYSSAVYLYFKPLSMYLLIPGRHHLLTRFQHRYLTDLLKNGLKHTKDVHGNTIDTDEPVEAIIFAVTSANHSNTRRNPLPFYLRAIGIEAFAQRLNVPVYVYGIDDVGNLEQFAPYTLKRIRHDSDMLFDCKPVNTLVVCSTPVLNMYHELGFTILPAELEDINTWKHHATMPWDLVTRIASLSSGWQEDQFVKTEMDASAIALWKKYRLAEKVQLLFRDSMISSDGDLTETRDYNVYVRQMDDIAILKYKDTADLIQPGRIGDIGCAVGSWLKLASSDQRLRESDLYGIEVSRHLYEICRQRKENGEFSNPFIFFSQKNAVTGLVFEPDSMNTIHTSSLTHEIESYGSREDLIKFIRNRYSELAQGGVWINRDVVGPYNKEQQVYLLLNKEDGSNGDPYRQFADRHELSGYLQSLSTHSRFLRFASDFRKKEGFSLPYKTEERDGKEYIVCSLAHASEYLSRKDYTDNWESEMHETFCFWDFDEWKSQLIDAGFSIHPSSRVFTNQWIADNRWKGKASIFKMEDGKLVAVDYPVTTMFLTGIKQ
jgi:hypothetical protein